MKFNVTAPEAGYDGKVGNVQFTDGKAAIDEETNPAELAYARSAGYLVEPVEAEDSGPAEPGPFDPAEHDVKTVLAHLDAADADEATRVLDAEADGKNRKGITDQRDAILASKKEEK